MTVLLKTIFCTISAALPDPGADPSTMDVCSHATTDAVAFDDGLALVQKHIRLVAGADRNAEQAGPGGDAPIRDLALNHRLCDGNSSVDVTVDCDTEPNVTITAPEGTVIKKTVNGQASDR